MKFSLSDLFKHSSIYLVGTIARRIVGLLMVPLYTRYLLPADYGLIELIELFIMVAVIVFGTMEVLTAMTRMYYEQPSEQLRSVVVSTSVFVLAGISGVIALIGSVASPTLSSYLVGSPAYSDLIRIAFLAVLFGNITELGLVYIRLRQRPALFVTLSMIQLLLNLTLNVVTIVYMHLGVWGFAWSKLISTAITAVLLLGFVYREVPISISWKVCKSLAAFGGPLLFASMSIFCIHFADRFFLKHYAGMADIGVYSLAYKFAFLVAYVVGEPFNNKWEVSLYGYSDPGWQQEFGRVLRYLVIALFAVFLAISLFGGEVVQRISSTPFWGAAGLIPVLALGYVFRQVGDFFRGIVYRRRKVYWASTVAVACGVLNLILNGILISRYQALGAAWATLLTWAVYMVGYWSLSERLDRIPYSSRGFGLLCGAVVSLVWLQTRLSSLPVIWRLTIDGAFLLAFVSASVWLSLTRGERQFCVSFLAQYRNGVPVADCRVRQDV